VISVNKQKQNNNYYKHNQHYHGDRRQINSE